MTIQPYSRNVFYYETDRMDVVSHTNYIRWMEEARTDFMEKVGLSYHQLEQSGIMLPVLNLSCQYKNPFRFGDCFSIRTYVTEYNGLKLTLSYEMFQKGSSVRCAAGTSSHCFTDTNMKPLRINRHRPELHEFFLNAMQAVYEESES